MKASQARFIGRGLRLALLMCGIVALAAGASDVFVSDLSLGVLPRDASQPGVQSVDVVERESAAASKPGVAADAVVVPAQTPDAAGGWTSSTQGSDVKNDKRTDKTKPPKGDPPVVPPDDPADPPVDPPVDPEPQTAPGVPVLTACTSGDMADTVAFEPAAQGGPVATFSLLRASAPDGTFSVVATAAPEARSFVFPVAECGAAYYAVSAEGPGGASAASEAAPNARVSISGEVLPEGRIFRASNGEVSLALAPGSYSGPTTVTIEELPGTATGPFISLAGIYDIEPSGPLGAPATLSVAYSLEVEQAQIVDVLLRAAGLLTYDTATASWVRVADARVDGSYLTGELTHFSPYTNGTYQPHGTSGLAVNYCTGVCHDLAAPTNADIRLDARDSQVCYFCHGNEPHTATAKGIPGGRNIEAEFFDVLAQPLPAARTTHPVGQGLYCTSCHDPHKDPAVAGNQDLLRAYDAVSGAAITSGDGFCWTCHGIVRNRRVAANLAPFRPLGYDYFTATGGDHKTGYATSAHAGVNQNGSVTCANCHGPHGGAEDDLLPARQFSGCTGATGNACHSDPANSAAGSNIKAQLVAGGVNDLTHHDIDPAAQVRTGSTVDCTSCHNVHRSSVDQPVADPDNLGQPMPAGGAPAMLDSNGSAWLRVGAEHDGVAPTINVGSIGLSTGSQWLSPAVTWTTNEVATSWVEWGLTTAYGNTAGNNTLLTSHSASMSGLVQGTTYNYRIKTADALGNIRYSANMTYTPYAPPPVPTMLDLGTYVGNNDGFGVTVEATATTVACPDGHAVEYRFLLNGSALSGWLPTPTWVLGLYDGTYTVAVQARDSFLAHQAAASDWSAADTFTVTNAPDPGSCPDLFTWNGTGFSFVTDVMGLGPIGIQKRNGDYVKPEPVEDSVIPQGMLVPNAGSLDIHLTDDRAEIEYVDEVKLVAVDHPAGTRLLLNDLQWSAVGVPRPATEYYTVSEPRTVAATYERVPVFSTTAVPPTEVTAELSAERDGLVSYGALYDDNVWTFDFGELGDPGNIKLILSGWTEYPNDAEKAAWLATGKQRSPSRIEVQDASGAWLDAGVAAFIPGFPKTVVYDLSGLFPEGVTQYRVRIRTYQRMHVDYAGVDITADSEVITQELAPSAAQLSYRGVVRDEATPYPVFMYDELASGQFPLQTGAFTRFGDVAELLLEPDDRFVIMGTGDDLAISFDEPAAAPAPGMTRTYVIHTDGYHDTLTGTVDPLPFHAMSNYPYGVDEHYPDDAEHLAYLADWNTRIHVEPFAEAFSIADVTGYSALSALAASIPATYETPPALGRLEAEPSGVSAMVSLGDVPYSIATDQVFARVTTLDGEVLTVPVSAGWQSTTASFATGPTPASPGAAVGAAVTGLTTTRNGQYWATNLTSTNNAVNWQLMRFDMPIPGWAVSTIELVWFGHGEPTALYEVKVESLDPATGLWTGFRNAVTVTDTEVKTSVSTNTGSSAFCIKCHDAAAPAGVVFPATPTYTAVGVDWGLPTGDYHGGRSGVFNAWGPQLQPGFYRATSIPCATCHASHGSGSVYHFASTIGGVPIPTITSGTNVQPMCSACHAGTVANWHPCGCHGEDDGGFHVGGVLVGPLTTDTYLQDCFSCHKHGSSWTHVSGAQADCFNCASDHGNPPSSPRTF